MKNAIRILIAIIIVGTWFQVANVMATEQAVPLFKQTETTTASDNQQETGYWMTTASGKRHNKNCRFYKNSKGHFCGPKDGIPRKTCGG